MRTLDVRDYSVYEVTNIVERYVVSRQNSLPIEILVEQPEALKKVIYALEEHDFRFALGSNCVRVLE